MSVVGVTTPGVLGTYRGAVELSSRRSARTPRTQLAGAVWYGFVEALIAPGPVPVRRSRAHRWWATALTLLGLGLAAVAVVRLVVTISHPPRVAVPVPRPGQPSGVLGLSVALAPLLLAARYPLIAWRVAYLVALLVPLVPGQPSINILQAIVLVLLFCGAGVQQQRPVLWWMWALMLVPTWIWVGPGWVRPAIVTICLSATTLALDAIATSGRAREALAQQVRRTELEVAGRAVLEERTRIAREMHDVVAHHMSMIAVQAETAPYRLGGLNEAALAEFAALSRAARDAMGDMRKLLGVLRSDKPAARAPQPQLSDIPELVEATQTRRHRDRAVHARQPRRDPGQRRGMRLPDRAGGFVQRWAPRTRGDGRRQGRPGRAIRPALGAQRVPHLCCTGRRRQPDRARADRDA